LQSIVGLINMFRWTNSVRIALNCLTKLGNRHFSQSASLRVSSAQLRDSSQLNVNRENVETNTFTNRSHHCGQLRVDHEGERVKLVGWLSQQRMGRFLVLRDAYGQVQLQVSDDLVEELRRQNVDLRKVPLESVLEVSGVVVARPVDQINVKMATGQIEILADSVHVLSRCSVALPFTVRDAPKVAEHLRLKYRYLELRSAHLQRALRLRSEFLCNVRHLLGKKFGFVEIETPTLFKRTPGGAQEFCVPTRHRNRHYSLTQSPQQFKQMLMVGGLDRYFQIARCYRDETSRADRQPEFTQIDLELSFTSPSHIQQLVEQILMQCWPADLPSIQVPFPRITFDQAMTDFGTDQPDVRLPIKLKCLPQISDDRGHVHKFEIKRFQANDDRSEVDQLKELSCRLLRQFNLENKAQLQVYIGFTSDALVQLDPENLAQFSEEEIALNEEHIKQHWNHDQNEETLHCFVVGRNRKAASLFCIKI
jgi:aspartyl-tRNA synthetase